MTYSFHPNAEIELNASVDYYQECKDGLGAEFAYEVQKTIQRVLEFPTAWHKLDRKPNYWKDRRVEQVQGD